MIRVSLADPVTGPDDAAMYSRKRKASVSALPLLFVCSGFEVSVNRLKGI